MNQHGAFEGHEVKVSIKGQNVNWIKISKGHSEAAAEYLKSKLYELLTEFEAEQ